MARFVNPITGDEYEQDKNGKLRLVEDRAYYLRQQAKETADDPRYLGLAGAVNPALIAAGETFSDIYRGAANLVDPSGAAQRGADDELLAASMDALRQEQGLATGIGSALPYLAMFPLGGAQAVGTDAALGILQGYRDQDVGEALKSGALNAAFSAAPFAAAGGARYVRDRMSNRVASAIRGQADEIAKPLREAAEIAEGRDDYFSNVRPFVDESVPLELRLQDAGLEDMTRGRPGSVGAAGITDDIDMATNHQEALEDADLLGWRTTPGQTGDNVVTETAENAMRRIGVDGFYEQVNNENQQLAAREIGKVFGIKTNELGTSTLARMKRRESDLFAEVREALPAVRPDKKFYGRMAALQQASHVSPVGKSFREQVPELINAAENIQNGNQAMLFREDLSKLYGKHLDDADRNYWRDTLNEFDLMIKRQAPKGIGQKYDQARQLWRLRQVVADKHVTNARGQINWPTFFNRMSTAFPNEMLAREGRLFKLAHVGRRFGAETKTSGTAENLSLTMGLLNTGGEYAAKATRRLAARRAAARRAAKVPGE